jgi:phosphate starvation-inducible PhoH-like protein
MRRRIDHGLIDIVPLGRMRGRTFNESVIVVDEAQNLTIRKMRMALTRMGRGSRMIVTGDPNQSDLPDDEISGLGHILPLIREADLAIDERQIVPNDIVAKIEALYGQADELSLRFVA